MKILYIELCNECPHHRPEDIDEGHGCAWTPPYCKKAKRDIYPKKDLEDGKSFPAWCPLKDKK